MSAINDLRAIVQTDDREKRLNEFRNWCFKHLLYFGQERALTDRELVLAQIDFSAEAQERLKAQLGQALVEALAVLTKTEESGPYGNQTVWRISATGIKEC